MQQYISFSPTVAAARAAKKPILALESTILTHGLPSSHQLEVANVLEDIAYQYVVTPATIAIVNGQIKIGLTEQELNELLSHPTLTKASKRDIPYLLANQGYAGTTVAATLFCAHLAGINVFATGGIGGVHRGDSNDISADLFELAQTPVAVVCAGAKAILDIPRTIEYLETFSVPVIGYQTDVYPAFYANKTTYAVPCRVDNVDDLARIIKIHFDLNMKSAPLIVNPIPTEFAIPATMLDPVINQAIESATMLQVTGKAITPYLLSEVAKATANHSLQANIGLIKNNVRLGAQLAKQLMQ